jgi:MFS family permease
MDELAAGPIASSPVPVPVRVSRGFQLLLVTIATTAVAYARTAVSPLQETMRIALALSDNQMAMLQGPALALPVVLAAIPLGLLIDRYSRVHLLFIFAVLSTAGSVLTALASNFALLFAARCLVGLAATAISTTAFSLLADLYAPAQRGRASMVVVVGQYGGMSAAFALGGALLAISGAGPDAWRWTMLWLIGPLVPVIFSMLAMREPARTGLVIEKPSAREICVELWRYRAVIAPLLIGLVMAEVAVLAVLTWAAPTLSRSFVLSPDRIGAIMAMGLMLSGILGPTVGGILADLCQRTGGPRRTMSILSGLALLNVPAGLFAVMPEGASASVLLVVFMTIGSAMLVTGIALFTIVIPNELRGLCMAALTGAGVLLGLGLAPVAVSLLSGALGGPAKIGNALALVCVAAGLLGTASFALGIRYFSRKAVQ